ncbi:MAG: vWA domain-containing protein [Acidimicrobiales bacterium]
MSPLYAYSRWDGTQVGFESDATDILSQLSDDLLYHGDVGAALRRLLQSGFADRSGERVAGLRELMERLRQRRRDELERWDMGGLYEDIAQALREVMDTEAASLDLLESAAADSGDPARIRATQDVASQRRTQLDLVPPDLAGRIRALQGYEFTSTEARERFEELVEQLRSQVSQSQFNQMQAAIASVGPEQLERQRQMYGSLNRMIEQREAGQALDPSFEDFMERFGDMVPGNPSNLDELLAAIAAQMAAMSSMLASMSPDQRAQIQQMMSAMLEDMDLRWQVERLAANLRAALPQAGWDRQWDFGGVDPLGLAEGAGVLRSLSDLDELENLLRSAQAPGALADVDLDKARQLMGDADAASLERLATLARMLEEAGLISQREGRLSLTARGMRRIGDNALAAVFSRLSKDRIGQHSLERPGLGHEREHATKAYEWGDPFNLSIPRTLHNAIQRGALQRGSGIPVALQPADFEVERTETTTRSSTVLAIDLSLSMPMRDNFLAAKRVALALHSLISTRYPRDFLGLVGFGELARELSAAQLPEVSWDFAYGTNIEHALLLARRMLSRQSGAKQVIMITDGEPTAHLLPEGDPRGPVHFEYPSCPETIQATLAQAVHCTRERIRINTFMLDATSYLRAFVEHMTRLNGGRAFYTTPENLGDYVLVDFLDHKRSLLGSHRI